MSQPSKDCPEEIHKKIRSTSPKANEHDFIIWTDGSGYDYGYGGSCAIVKNVKKDLVETRITASYAQTTHRAEFEALLMGLQCVLEMGGWDVAEQKHLLDIRTGKPTICWYTDSESLALSVYRDESGDPLFQRKSAGDLWARFSYYETCFRITPLCIKRNSTPEHARADRLASESRLLIKDYMEILYKDEVI